MGKVYLVISLIIGIIVLGTVIFFSTRSKPVAKGSPNIPVFSPSPSASQQSAQSLTPVPSSENTGYSAAGMNQNYQRTAGATLSVSDQAVFKTLTTNLDGNSNIIVKTTTFEVEYVNPPNEFLIQVLSNNANQGKADAINWLKQQGFSTQGVCQVKAVIYLSPSVQSYYQQNNLQFNPVPDGC